MGKHKNSMLLCGQAEHPLIAYDLDPFARDYFVYLQEVFNAFQDILSLPDRFKILVITE